MNITIKTATAAHLFKLSAVPSPTVLTRNVDGAMSDRIDIPAVACRFAEPLERSGMDSPDSKPRRFAVLATTGKIMPHPWLGSLAVDLKGIELPSGPIPSLLDHDPSQRLGRATDHKLTDAGLMSTITFLDNEFAAQVLADADGGFPWQASVQVPPLEIEEVGEGSSAEVNGLTMEGPGLIFRRSVLREVSITALGVDDQTKAEALSAGMVTAKLTYSPHSTRPDSEPEEGLTMDIKTIEQLRAQFPVLCEALLADANCSSTKIATDVERARVMEILEICHADEVPTVLKYIREGTESKDAFRALLTSRGKSKETKLEALAANSEEAVTPKEGTTPDELAAMTIEDRTTHEWENTPKLRAEFPVFAIYLAYRRNSSNHTTKAPPAPAAAS